MGVKTEQVGGGGATAVSNEFSNMLLQGLQGGFGAVPGWQNGPTDAYGRGGGNASVANVLGMLFSGNGANGLITQAEQAKTRSIGDMRERFSIGGSGYGTPASSAEAQYRAQVDPQIASIYSQQVMQALSQILPMYGQQAQLGTPQAQIVQTPSFGANLLSGITGLAGAAAPFFAPGLGSSIPAAPSMPGLNSAAQGIQPVALPPLRFG